MSRQVYLDHNATTPLDPQAFEAMRPYLLENYGNPSSLHWAGSSARKGLDDARALVANCFDVEPGEIVFTSGGTESSNVVIKGLLENVLGCPRVIVSPLEHHCVLEPLEFLNTQKKIELVYLPVDEKGKILPEDVQSRITENTALIAVMFANNETGSLNPIREIGKIAREAKVPFLCDGVQAVGKVPVHLKELSVDFFTFSAHKFYGPKGVGGLYIRKGMKLASLIQGGEQELKRRGGTENVSGIVGLAAALKKVTKDISLETKRVGDLRDLLWERVKTIRGAQFFGNPENRLANTLLVGFEGVESEIILVTLDREGIAVSNGAACASGALKASHVLQGMGFSNEVARGAVRFSLGCGTTEDDILYVGEKLPFIVERLR